MNTYNIQLPSKGLTYNVPEGVDRTFVTIREPVGKDEMLLTNMSLISSGELFIKLIRNVLVDETWKNVDFLSGDVDAILFAIRYLMYGNYNVNVDCRKCGAKNEVEFDLSQIDLKPIGAEPITVGENLFLYEVDGITVKFMLPTDSSEKELNKFIEATKSKMQVNPIYERYIRLIKSVDNINEPGKIRDFLETKIKVSTFRKIRQYITDINPGVIKKCNFICNSCGESYDIDIVAGVDFFWVI